MGLMLRKNGEFINKNKEIPQVIEDDDIFFTFENWKVKIVSETGYETRIKLSSFASQSIITPYCTVNIQYLDKELKERYPVCIYITDFLPWTKNNKEAKHISKRYNNSYSKHKPDKYRNPRWLITWEYNGNSYEVIYGESVSSYEEIWSQIKNDSSNKFSQKEVDIIDSWFK